MLLNCKAPLNVIDRKMAPYFYIIIINIKDFSDIADIDRGKEKKVLHLVVS